MASLLFSLLLAIWLGRVAAQDSASSIHEGCIHMPIIHSKNPQFMAKRAVSVALANHSDIAYYAQLTIGTPGQSVFAQLDTGSFELWVNPDCSSSQGSDVQFCRSAGFYDTTKSSTASSLGTGKTLRYGIGTANITYFKDNIALPGSTTGLKGVQFGVATSSQDAMSGILGIGYGQGLTTTYRNFIDELSAQGATQVKAFTVALGSKQEEEGSVVFGGVDTSKFSGPLARLPIIPAADSPDRVPRYWVDMQSVSLSPPRGATRPYPNTNFPVFFDTGATMTLLPQALANAIAADFGSPGPDAQGFYEVDCGATAANGTLDFAFSGMTIQVPYDELVRTVQSSPPACFLGISPSSEFALLGDTFMRSAYATFDLDNNAIWLAQAQNCGSTPTGLASMSSMASLRGACGTRNAVSAGGGSGESGSSGSAAPGPADSGGSASTGTSPGAASSADRASVGRLIWAAAVLAAVLVGT